MTTGISINDPGRSLTEGREAAGERPGFSAVFGSGVMEGRSARQPDDSCALRARDVMTRNVRSCRPGDTLAAAVMAMCEADCRFLPVLNETGRPIGVVTDGDICLLGTTSHRRLSDMSVKDAMSGSPATCRAEDDVLGLLRVMRERRIRHLLVVGPQGLLEGVVSLTDIVLRALEDGSSALLRELFATLRDVVQKQGDVRIIEHNPFVED